MNNFFDKIAGRYGVSPEALADAWNKTAGQDHETHVKKFKQYLHKLTGESHYNFDIPQMDERVTEAIAQKMLEADFAILKEMVEEAKGKVKIDD